MFAARFDVMTKAALTFKMVNYFLFPVADTEANFMCFSTFTSKQTKEKKIEVKINHKKLFIKIWCGLFWGKIISTLSRKMKMY